MGLAGPPVINILLLGYIDLCPGIGRPVGLLLFVGKIDRSYVAFK